VRMPPAVRDLGGGGLRRRLAGGEQEEPAHGTSVAGVARSCKNLVGAFHGTAGGVATVGA
jgi:hypothetical protein